MVMIPVGNNTKHCFRLWAFLIIIIRLFIFGAVSNVLGFYELTGISRLLITALFFTWAFRPVYMETKYLFRSWREAKYLAECEKLEVSKK